MLNTDVVQAAPAVNDTNDPRSSATDRRQKYWTVDEVEHWMHFGKCFGELANSSPPIVSAGAARTATSST